MSFVLFRQVVHVIITNYRLAHASQLVSSVHGWHLCTHNPSDHAKLS